MADAEDHLNRTLDTVAIITVVGVVMGALLALLWPLFIDWLGR